MSLKQFEQLVRNEYFLRWGRWPTDKELKAAIQQACFRRFQYARYFRAYGICVNETNSIMGTYGVLWPNEDSLCRRTGDFVNDRTHECCYFSEAKPRILYWWVDAGTCERGVGEDKQVGEVVSPLLCLSEVGATPQQGCWCATREGQACQGLSLEDKCKFLPLSQCRGQKPLDNMASTNSSSR